MHDLIINDLLHMKVYIWDDQSTINDCICIVLTMIIQKDLKVLFGKIA